MYVRARKKLDAGKAWRSPRKTFRISRTCRVRTDGILGNGNNWTTPAKTVDKSRVNRCYRFSALPQSFGGRSIPGSQSTT